MFSVHDGTRVITYINYKSTYKNCTSGICMYRQDKQELLHDLELEILNVFTRCNNMSTYTAVMY
jgi:hypothetical protein